jgi:tetratricopeptide (TPR) repeat protein
MFEGEFGIGKKYAVNKFFTEKNISTDDIIQIDAALTSKSSYAAINQAIYKLLMSKRLVDEQQSRNLAKKASLLIPKFGEMAAHFIGDDRYNEALYDVIRRAGVNTESYNILSIAKFLEELTVDKRVVLYCSNLQWFDEQSWEIILKLIPVIADRGWFCIFSYTVNVDQPSIKHCDIEHMLSRLNHLPEINRNFIHTTIDKWRKSDLPCLCESILKGKVSFTKSQINTLSQYTEGLPLYVKIILEALAEHGDINLAIDGWGSKENWDSERIRTILQNIVQQRINSVYANIPQCRDILEVGSAIKEDFTDEVISGIFNNNPTTILHEVEKRYRVIQYIMDNRMWKFEHFIIQDYVYRSLGDKAQDIHLLVAKYLERNTKKYSHIKIAQHYYLAGDNAKFAEHYLSEIKSLMDSGCYKSALRFIDDLSDCHEFAIFISGKEHDFLILKGRAKFHNICYREAIEIFTPLLYSNNSEEFKAECSKWLAKTYLKLDSQEDFNHALIHLKSAESYYREKGDYSAVGDILLDFIVAYAHINDKQESRRLYAQTESCFNAAQDRIGLLRLYRRSIIFMDPKLSAPILYKAATAWGTMNVRHEKIMSLNNAAVQYYSMNDYDRAYEILIEALNESIEFNDFGMVYIHNNLGVINALKGSIETSHKNFAEARKGKFRAVEQLIVDINESISSIINNPEATISILESIYRRASLTGEESYIVPSAINLGIALLQTENINQVITLFEPIEEAIAKYQDYNLVIWYNLMRECYTRNNELIKYHNLIERYDSIVTEYTESYPDFPKYAYITMDFWSDN